MAPETMAYRWRERLPRPFVRVVRMASADSCNIEPMLNWLVVGIGDITTRRVIPAILAEPRSNLYGILTRQPAKAESYPAKVFLDLTTALADHTIGAVYVASPVFLHASQTIQSLRAGKHVLCEKPVAMNYEQALSMVAAAQAAEKELGISYYRRTYPKVNRARELLAQGVIGKPVLAYASCHSWFTAGDGKRAWLLDPAAAGGGPLYDIGSHRIDLLNYLFDEPQHACGHLSRVVHKSPVEDNATVMVEYRSGVRGIVDVRWHSHVDRDEFTIIGTDGEMNLTPLSGPEILYPGGREQLPAHANLHYPCVANFVAAVLDGAPLLSSGSSAAWTDWVTQQVMSAQKSEDSGSP
jgi:1,5-anhydro-D-fructose reductase (1,5-anhydro-D-mannitol-forming)